MPWFGALRFPAGAAVLLFARVQASPRSHAQCRASVTGMGTFRRSAGAAAVRLLTGYASKIGLALGMLGSPRLIVLDKP